MKLKELLMPIRPTARTKIWKFVKRENYLVEIVHYVALPLLTLNGFGAEINSIGAAINIF